MTPADVSVVIPAINEECTVAGAIASALQAGAGEVIVADGGSNDRTREIASQSGASKIVRSLPGRGIQLNSGSLLADREILLFLHADNRLGVDCLEQICHSTDVTWGAFRQRIDASETIFRLIESGNAMRVAYLKKPFGDQAMFVRRDLFKQQGGFAEIPLMEDVELSIRLRAIAKPRLLDGPVSISARRWQQKGPVGQTLLNWSIQFAYWLGVPAEKLKQRYH